MDEFLLECCFKACDVESTDSALCYFDSALCCIVQSHDAALCCIARITIFGAILHHRAES
jgi:hypothetical protein